jgi:pseudaminic acid cytidylyltransferase
MSAIAIITARGGSKRIPRKNVREFAGKPMIAWPIETAIRSQLFDHVIVSTDDPEIARVAADAGAEVPFTRPLELSDDHSGTLEVVGHAVDWARTHDRHFDCACCLYGTAAFTSTEDLADARDRSHGWDYVFAAGRFIRPPQRAFIKDAAGAMSLLCPEFALARSQDLEVAYYDAGQFYWGSAAAWSERRPIFGERTTFIELPPERAIDIDTPEDWAMAERQFSEWKRARG